MLSSRFGTNVPFLFLHGEISLRSILPGLGISPGMQDSEDQNPVLVDYIKYPTGKTSNEGPANILVYYGIHFRGSLDG
jgi:hypothetical protein